MTRRTRRARRIALAAALPAAALAAGWVIYRLLPARQERPGSYRREEPPGGWVPGAALRVMTLNIAHGRALAGHQALCRTETIEDNLAAIAAVLRRERPDVVALQESDLSSPMTGRFDQAARLGELAGLEGRFSSVGSRRLGHGAALLSRTPLGDPVAHRFDPTGLTPTKNFAVATVDFPGGGRKVDVVSVHLDFLRGSSRADQVETIAGKLAPRARPLVLMGDFNCSWDGREDSLRRLGERLGVRPFMPAAPDLYTFESGRPRRRLDWILISEDLDFEAYAALPDLISDHLAVTATIRLRAAGPPAEGRRGR